MEYALSAGGLLVHSRDDWPCAICRPDDIAESRGYCLCVNCAQRVIAAAAAGVEDARALMNEITDALFRLQYEAPRIGQALN